MLIYYHNLKAFPRFLRIFRQNSVIFVKNIKFCVGDVEKVVAYDDLGKSAIDSIEKRLTNDELGKTLCVIWKKNSKQESCGGAE